MRIVRSRALRIKSLARKVVSDHGFDSLPVNPREIAENLDIEIQEFPPEMEGVSGCLMKCGDSFGIGFSTAIDSVGFQNFTIAHELGHYHIDGHAEALLSESIHYSKAYDSKGDPFEREADLFASELLMPWALIKSLLMQGVGLDTVKEVAEQCNTSLVASAIKVVNHTKEQIAMVMLHDGVVEYMLASEEFRFIPGVTFLEKGEELSEELNFMNMCKSEVLHSKEATIDCNLSDIFSKAPRVPATLEMIGLGSYGRLLCLIQCDWADELQREDEDTNYIDRWKTGGFRPRGS